MRERGKNCGLWTEICVDLTASQCSTLLHRATPTSFQVVICFILHSVIAVKISVLLVFKVVYMFLFHQMTSSRLVLTLKSVCM